MLGDSAQATEPTRNSAERRQDDRAPAVDVGELAVERRHRGRGEEIGGDDPGQEVGAAERGADGRQRRGDDGGIERGEKHRQQDANDDIALGVPIQCSVEHSTMDKDFRRGGGAAQWAGAREGGENGREPPHAQAAVAAYSSQSFVIAVNLAAGAGASVTARACVSIAAISAVAASRILRSASR